jgi:branched-chain amino acid transport system substrate-binding protein
MLTACQSPPRFECTDAIGCISIAPGEPLKIGVMQALSGPMAAVGTDQVRAMKLALAAQNDQFLGHPIELLIEDSQCSAEGGTIAAMKLVADPQIVAMLGTTCSGSATAMVGTMSEAGLSMISGTNTAISLTSLDNQAGEHWQPGYFRTANNDAQAAETAAAFAFTELGLKKAAVIDDGDAYTRSFANAFKQIFTKLGGEIVLDSTIDKGDTDMRPVLTAAALSGAEIVFFPLFSPEADFIVSQTKEIDGLQDAVLMAGGAILTDDFITSVGAAGVGMYIVSAQPVISQGTDELMAAYEAAYHERPHTNSLETAYDAGQLLLHALESVAVREKDSSLHIGRQALRDALYATTGFEGVTGALACDQFGDCSAVEFVVLRFDDPAAGLDGLRSNIVYRTTQK